MGWRHPCCSMNFREGFLSWRLAGWRKHFSWFNSNLAPPFVFFSRLFRFFKRIYFTCQNLPSVQQFCHFSLTKNRPKARNSTYPEHPGVCMYNKTFATEYCKSNFTCTIYSYLLFHLFIRLFCLIHLQPSKIPWNRPSLLIKRPSTRSPHQMTPKAIAATVCIWVWTLWSAAAVTSNSSLRHSTRRCPTATSPVAWAKMLKGPGGDDGEAVGTTEVFLERM